MRRIVTASLTVLSAAALAVSLSACSSGSKDSMSSGDAKPSTSSSQSSTPSASSDSAMMRKSGSFTGLNGKQVAGTVEVTGTELALSGFSSDEGPDLHVYLTRGTDEAAVEAGMRIDAIKFDAAAQKFTLSGVDLSEYTDVVIHCDKAKAVFGAAKLA